MGNSSYQTYRKYIELFLNKLKEALGEDLLSFALFGSIAPKRRFYEDIITKLKG